MVSIKEFLNWEIRSGTPVSVGDTIVTPKSQALFIRLPFGGFVWNRPMSVTVERDGRTELIPIPDVTRIVLLRLMAIGFALTILPWMWRLMRRNAQH